LAGGGIFWGSGLHPHADDTSGAERAFDALRAEVAALRQAVEGQAQPDYALTLGAIVKELQAVGGRRAADGD